MPKTETDDYGKSFPRYDPLMNGDQTKEDAPKASVPPPPPPFNSSGPRLSSTPPPVSARPKEGSRPVRATDVIPNDSVGTLSPPTTEEPQTVRRPTLSEKWHANRHWLVPALWIGFILLLGVRVVMTDLTLVSAALLLVVAFLVNRVYSAIQRRKRIARKSAEAKLRTSVGNRAIVVLSNSGGAGKSTLTALLATALRISGKTRAVIDFNNNSGDIGRKLGIMKGFTARIRNIHARIGNHLALNTIFKQLHVNDDGIVLIDSEVNQKSADELTEAEVPEVIDAVGDYFSTVLVDNGTNNTGRYEMASAQRADIALFVGQTGKPATVRAIPETIEAYYDNGITDIKSRAIVVVSRPRRFFMRKRNQLTGLDSSIPVLTIPWDPFLMTDSAIKYDRLFKRSHEAMLDLILAICDLVPMEPDRLSPEVDATEWIEARLGEKKIKQIQSQPPTSTPDLTSTDIS